MPDLQESYTSAVRVLPQFLQVFYTCSELILALLPKCRIVVLLLQNTLLVKIFRNYSIVEAKFFDTVLIERTPVCMRDQKIINTQP